jgi:hypothetical protein
VIFDAAMTNHASAASARFWRGRSKIRPLDKLSGFEGSLLGMFAVAFYANWRARIRQAVDFSWVRWARSGPQGAMSHHLGNVRGGDPEPRLGGQADFQLLQQKRVGLSPQSVVVQKKTENRIYREAERKYMG